MRSRFTAATQCHHTRQAKCNHRTIWEFIMAATRWLVGKFTRRLRVKRATLWMAPQWIQWHLFIHSPTTQPSFRISSKRCPVQARNLVAPDREIAPTNSATWSTRTFPRTRAVWATVPAKRRSDTPRSAHTLTVIRGSNSSSRRRSSSRSILSAVPRRPCLYTLQFSRRISSTGPCRCRTCHEAWNYPTEWTVNSILFSCCPGEFFVESSYRISRVELNYPHITSRVKLGARALDQMCYLRSQILDGFVNRLVHVKRTH